METIGKIRRKKLVEGKGIRAISRELRLARNTVRRVLRGEVAQPQYRRVSQPAPKLGPFAQRLSELIESELRLPKAQRRTARRLFEALQAEGYDGAYYSVRRFAQRQRREVRPGAVFIPQAFEPGEAYQFDWSTELVELGGVIQKVKVAHFRLGMSRKFLVRAYPRETQEMVFDAHDRAFVCFGGVPRRGIYDNLKTAVDAVFVGKERKFNRRFLAMMAHYLIEPTACTPAAGWEKGQVESQVGTIREWLFVPRLKAKDFAELNAHLEQRCTELAATRAHPEFRDRTIAEVFATDEQPALQPLPGSFDGFHERTCRASVTSLVNFDRNRYSVDCRWAGRSVSLRAYAERIVIAADGEIIGEHARQFGRDKTVYNPWHYITALARKPGALRNGAPFREWQLPSGLKRVRETLMKRAGGDREFVEVLLAIRCHGLDAVGVACDLALGEGVVSAAHILNLLARLTEPAAATPIQAPDALRLTHEPRADLARYDALRSIPESPCPTPSPPS